MIKFTAIPMITVLLLHLAMLRPSDLPSAIPAELFPGNVPEMPFHQDDHLQSKLVTGDQLLIVHPTAGDLTVISHTSWNQRVLNENL